MTQRLVTVSKFLSKYLRHEPEALGLALEPGGWVRIDDVLSGAAQKGFPISKDELLRVVAENDKQRFSLDETQTRIRANQGHSAEVDLQLKEVAPPPQLFHGTVAKFLDSILAAGLQKMDRHDVHLSKDVETATKVGRRRGKPIILVIDSPKMAADGYKFRLSENGVWLTDHVPVKYIRLARDLRPTDEVHRTTNRRRAGFMRHRMTEAEWFASSDSYSMLRPCRRIIRYCPRKGDLFAVACCYRIWHLLTDMRSREAVETVARYVEGTADDLQLLTAAKKAQAAHADAFREKGKLGASAEWAAQFATDGAWHAASRASNFAYVAVDGIQNLTDDPGPEKAAQAHLLRCIFGPLPFRPVTIDPACRTPNVIALAQAIYNDRAFDRLPALANALVAAGCDNQDILAHCRSEGPHVRGCWVVDLVLGKK